MCSILFWWVWWIATFWNHGIVRLWNNQERSFTYRNKGKRLIDEHLVRYVIEHEMLGGDVWYGILLPVQRSGQQWKNWIGHIRPLNINKNEFEVTARGSTFHLLVGKHAYVLTSHYFPTQTLKTLINTELFVILLVDKWVGMFT